MANNENLRNIEEMINYFTQKGEFAYVSTLIQCKLTLFQELAGDYDLSQEKEIDAIIESLDAEARYLENENARRIEILPKSMQETIILSLGSSGHSFLNTVIEKRWWLGCSFMSVDYDYEELNKSKAEKLLSIGDDEYNDAFSSADLNITKMLGESYSIIKSAIKEENRKNIVLVFNAGGRISEAVESLIKLCRDDIGMNVVAASILPFGFEDRRNHAFEIQKKIEVVADHSIFLDSDEVFSFVNKRTAMPYCIGVLHEILAERISALFNTVKEGDRLT